MSELLQKQFKFARNLATLIIHIYSEGYTVTMGEAYRSPEEAKRLAKLGRGIVTSLHIDRLACDLQLFKNGVWMFDGASYKPFGEFWKGLSETKFRCTWGGDFSKLKD